MRKLRIAFSTLGCKVNQYDTEAVAELFRSRGHEVVDFEDNADAYIINTCTVTGTGDKKSRQMARRAKRKNPDAVVAVMGCYVQVSPDEAIEIPGVDVAVGTVNRGRIVELVEEAVDNRSRVSEVRRISEAADYEDLPVSQFAERTRAVVKIEDGCENFCSYCKVPFARGPVRSRRPESMLEEVRRLSQAGYREVVLTGIHLGAWGTDFEHRLELADAVHMVHEVDGIERIRLSSIEPTDMTDRLIEAFATLPKLVPHVHMPLQAGDDDVLSMMRRKYRTVDYRRIVEKLRARIPELGLTTDVMVGFPGETDETFRRGLNFVREMAFSRLHVFKFSRRPGTRAYGMPGQVPARVKDQRSDRMIELGEELARGFHERFVGSEVEILVEESQPVSGLTGNYVRVTAELCRKCDEVLSGLDPEDLVGEFAVVKVESADHEQVYGRLVRVGRL